MPITGTHNLQILRGLSSNRCVLSSSPDGGNVDLYSKDDGSGRQRWNFNFLRVAGGENVYNIIIGGGVNPDKKKYLSSNQDGSNVDLYDKDDGSGRQRWELLPVIDSPTPETYVIKVFSGVSNNKVYLSCSADGSNVDLHSADDGSGRQRWQLQGVWQA